MNNQFLDIYVMKIIKKEEIYKNLRERSVEVYNNASYNFSSSIMRVLVCHCTSS